MFNVIINENLYDIGARVEAEEAYLWCGWERIFSSHTTWEEAVEALPAARRFVEGRPADPDRTGFCDCCGRSAHSLTNLGYPDSSGYMQNFCLCGACAPPNKHSTTMGGRPVPIHKDADGDEFCIIEGKRYYMKVTDMDGNVHYGMPPV